MAVHKVPQDVEADDKFFGPLTFKQFIFGGVTLVLGYSTFYTFTNGIIPIALVLLPFFLGFGALTVPWSKDQPTEIWLASRIRFFIVPHKRIWNQSGIKDLVTITAPKREAHIYTDGLTQDQVRSRFSALASVVDTRGWAVKSALAPVSPLIASPTGSMPLQQPAIASDRLVAASADSSVVERTQMVENTQDIMDDRQNPIAQQFNTLIEKSTEKHRQDTLAMIQQARHNAEIRATVGQSTGPILPAPVAMSTQTNSASTALDWVSKQPTKPADPVLTSFQDTAVIAPGASGSAIPSVGPAIATIGKADEESLLEHVKQKKQRDKQMRSRGHIKVVKTPEEIEAEKREAEERAAQEADEQARLAEEQARSASTATPDPVILSLADNNDLNIETISRQAKKDKDRLDDNTEVVISLR
jgi:hypothetical protein